MTDARAWLALTLLLAGCGEPRPAGRPGEQPSSAPPEISTPPPPPEPSPFYVGRWTQTQGQCGAEAWTFSRASLRAPDGTCAFDEAVAIPSGYRLRGMCRWAGADAPADISLAFAQSAQALLVSGQPVGEVGLTACPAG